MPRSTEPAYSSVDHPASRHHHQSVPFPTSPSSSLYSGYTCDHCSPVAAMTPASTSPLAAAVLPTNLSSFSRCPPRRLPRISCLAAPERGGNNASNASPAPQQPRWGAAVSAALAAAVVAASMPAYADLNKFEAEQRGEFGIGSAAQFGSADLKYASTSASSSLLHDRFVVTLPR